MKILLFLSLLNILCSCSRPGCQSIPEIYVRQTVFELLPRQEFILSGTVTDPTGVKAVAASCPALNIRKEVRPEKLPKTYPFLIPIQTPADAKAGKETMLLEVENAEGKIFSKELTLNIIASKKVNFHMGADISWVTEMEKNGENFRDTEGTPKGCMELMKDYGLDALRFRVWVDPKEHDNWCNLADLLVKCERARKMGFDIMIDFHYSDWWADPSLQPVPAAWLGHSYEQMKRDVAAHTTEVLQTLKDHDIEPLWVQIGNETNNGLLWPVGKAGKNPSQYAGLFMAGHDAAKAVFPDIKTIVHLGGGHDAGLYDWNLGILKEHGARWDIIGMSVYPFWANADTPEKADRIIEQSIGNMERLSAKYQCDMMVVETGMICAENGVLASEATLKESKRQLDLLIRKCKNTGGTRCKGIFYWEPECRPGKYRLGAFDAFGKPTIIMDAFKENR